MRCWFSFVLIFSKCRGPRANADVHNAARCDVRQNMECIPGKGRVMKSHLNMVLKARDEHRFFFPSVSEKGI